MRTIMRGKGSDPEARRSSVGPVTRAVFVLVAVALAASASGSEPSLTVWVSDAPAWSYALSSIDDIVLSGETLEVTTGSGTDSYPVESVTRLTLDLDEWTDVPDDEGALAINSALRLFQNRPNPFCPETRIGFELPSDGHAELRVYSVSGRLVRTLVQERRSAGPHVALWNGLDEGGHPVASGVYFYTLVAPGASDTRKMLLLR